MNNTKIKDINIIAEIGWNHMGDMKLAKQMIESAAKMVQIYVNFKHGVNLI